MPQRGGRQASRSRRLEENLMAAKVNTAVLGATGYSGLELARLLGRHPRTDAPLLFRRNAETETGDPDGSAAGSQHISGNGTHNANGNSPIRPFSWPALEQPR